MPAETHSYREEITESQVLELLWVLVTDPDSTDFGGEPEPHRSLEELGIDEDLALLSLWDATTEEYGERTLGDLDVEEARASRDLGQLAKVFARACAGDPDGEDD